MRWPRRRRPEPVSCQTPDLVAPVEAWRTWLVTEERGELRLASVIFAASWVPGEPAAATCRPQPYGWAGLVDRGASHRAPHPGCRCGIYAVKEPRQAARYLDQVGPVGRPPVWSVFGLVSLWGVVVEGEEGYRAAYAYPRALFVPRRRLLAKGWRRTGAREADADAVAEALSAYRAPVRVLDAVTKTAVGEEAPALL
jgi:hypothetical protein